MTTASIQTLARETRLRESGVGLHVDDVALMHGPFTFLSALVSDPFRVFPVSFSVAWRIHLARVQVQAWGRRQAAVHHHTVPLPPRLGESRQRERSVNLAVLYPAV